MGRSRHNTNKISSVTLLISGLALFCFVVFFGSGALVQTGYYTEQMKKSLDSFIRKALPEGYGEETVDRKKQQRKGTALSTTKDSRKNFEEWKNFLPRMEKGICLVAVL